MNQSSSTIELLDLEKILQELQPSVRQNLDELLILSTVDSTNNYLLELASPQPQTLACFAEQQTAGKGQRGKNWLSPPTGQIYFSLLWPFPSSPSGVMGLSLAMGIAVSRALRNYGIQDEIGVKWPNDIYHSGRKLVGILVETTPGTSGIYNVVIGIGVNLYLTSEQGLEINQPWTSMHQILNDTIQRNRFAGILLNETCLAAQQFAAEGFSMFHSEWRTLDYLYGKKITLTSPQQTLTGIMNGVSTRGELLLTDAFNRQHICLNGSVRLATS